MKISVLTILFCISYSLVSAKQQTGAIQDQIRGILEYETPTDRLVISGRELKTSSWIHTFYVDRNFEEVWTKDGILLELAYEMRYEIRESKYDGLNPEDYDLAWIEAYFKTFEANKVAKKPSEAGDLAALDLLLTNAFFQLAEDLEIGKVDPAQLKGDWAIERKGIRMDHLSLLNKAIAELDIRRNLEKLYPKFTIYKRSREVIRSLEQKSKVDSLSWKALKLDKSLKVGDTHSSVPQLRQRLQFWGYLEAVQLSDSKTYDSLMVEGVVRFQQKNGMEPDGIIGKNTVIALNASPTALMDKARVNMERLRWLPDTVQNMELIVVNIANFQLDYLNNLDTLFSSRVIVGKRYHESPIFRAEMSYIVFSPYWNIPYSITKNEIIPAVRKNPNYLQNKNMEVITTSGKPVNANSIDWSSKSFPYLIRQKPGGNNSLGLVKFMFPNSHSVYIHDTPARTLFDREDRAMSHGCIRLQNPADFAQLLLRDDPFWTPDKINAAMHQDREKIVNLPRKIPVVLLYLTFWSDSKGQPHFRQDIYNRDAEVLALLNQ
ncbi:L,D-transpeptidase family protein [Algoriphagus confluentis]|uniref:L,D-transpeptidase family protein n=1 Tax=Algoriphagus confluentis TaxID=1697556 RepID=A0ABQ6PWA6_9BACT|nr:L,D-transpeptidase family protein [Algoriphagus confluentis]